MHWYEMKQKAKGQTNSSVSQICRPEKIINIPKYLEQVGKNGVIARGAGSSYADQTLNTDGAIMYSKYLDSIRSFDEKTGDLVCEAGITLKTITELYSDKGFILATANSSGEHTLGGALASNLIGLNGFKKTSLAKSVNWIEVILATGETVRTSSTEKPELFKAVIGGQGLVGFISLVSIKLIKKPQENVEVLRRKYPNLDALLGALKEARNTVDFCSAWIDTSAGSDAIGRSILKTATFSKENKTISLFSISNFKLKLPKFALNLATFPIAKKIRFFFASTYKKTVETYASFLYPSDNIRVISQKGVYQVSFSFSEAEGPQAIRGVLTEIARTKYFACRAVLLLSKEDTLSYLGFSQKGYVLSLDFVCKKGLEEFLKTLITLASQHKGRVSLQKDGLLEPRNISMMYKNLEKFNKARNTFDALHKFDSDFARRLFVKEKNNEQ